MPSRLAPSRTAAYRFAPLRSLSERSISRKMASVISEPTNLHPCIGHSRKSVPDMLDPLKSAPLRLQFSKLQSLNVIFVMSKPSRYVSLMILSSTRSLSDLSLSVIKFINSSDVNALFINLLLLSFLLYF